MAALESVVLPEVYSYLGAEYSTPSQGGDDHAGRRGEYAAAAAAAAAAP